MANTNTEEYDFSSDGFQEIIRANDEDADFPGRSYSHAMKEKHEKRVKELEEEIDGYFSSMQAAWKEARQYKLRFWLVAGVAAAQFGIIVYLIIQLLR